MTKNLERTHTPHTNSPHAVLGMHHAGGIEHCLVILPEVENGLNVAVFIVWRHGFVADVKQSDLFILSNLGCELHKKEVTTL